jgi:hypothetical protein
MFSKWDKLQALYSDVLQRAQPIFATKCKDGASELNIEFSLMFYHERSPFSQKDCKGTTFLTNNYKK